MKLFCVLMVCTLAVSSAEEYPRGKMIQVCGAELARAMKRVCEDGDLDFFNLQHVQRKSRPIQGPRISNLNGACIRCLCHVAGCDINRGCSDGYCGPFFISRVYWVDAGKPTLPDDDPERKEAFDDCARDFHCSIRIVQHYMAKFGKDCNEDGVTDCFDYMLINYHGGACSKPLNTTESGRRWLKSYQECRF